MDLVKVLNFGQNSKTQVRLKILKLNFGQVLKAEVWSRLWGWRLVELLRLMFGQDFKAVAMFVTNIKYGREIVFFSG